MNELQREGALREKIHLRKSASRRMLLQLGHSSHSRHRGVFSSLLRGHSATARAESTHKQYVKRWQRSVQEPCECVARCVTPFAASVTFASDGVLIKI